MNFFNCWILFIKLIWFIGLSWLRRSTVVTWAFSVAGPMVWNSLPDSLRDPAVESEHFRQDFKTHLFAGHYRHECIRGVTVSRNHTL